MAIALPPVPVPVVWPAAGFADRRSTKPVVVRRRVGQWTVEVIRDPFAGEIRCSLHAPKMTYARAAMTFQFPAGADTFGAIYRVDQGPPTSWRADALALAAHGVSLQNETLNNPSGGRVAIPGRALVGARSVAIRPSPGAAVRTFKLDGLTAALRVAGSENCGPDFDLPADR